jgi:predicted nucleotidyltransferase/membrane protein implicated in regulation of membrane protease activity
MKKNKVIKLIHNPWIVGAGIAIFSYLLPSIHMSVAKNISIIMSLYTVGKIIANFVIRFFLFGVPLWVLILVFAALVALFVLFLKEKRKKHTESDWKKYTQEFYDKWLFTWEYVTNYENQVKISKLRPICSKCQCELSNQKDMQYLFTIGYYCPNCSSKFPALKANTLDNLEKIIIRNVNTGEYKLRLNKIRQGYTMTDAIKHDLETITNAITANTQTVAIYLFGSYAYGQPHEDSDLDIYAVIPDTDVDTLELGGRIRLDLYKKITMPFDLLIGKQSTFDRRKKMLTLESIIAQQGVKLHGN